MGFHLTDKDTKGHVDKACVRFLSRGAAGQLCIRRARTPVWLNYGLCFLLLQQVGTSQGRWLGGHQGIRQGKKTLTMAPVPSLTSVSKSHCLILLLA